MTTISEKYQEKAELLSLREMKEHLKSALSQPFCPQTIHLILISQQSRQTEIELLELRKHIDGI